MSRRNTERKGKIMENQNKLIDQFHKNSQELIEVHLSEWKGKDYVDLRIWHLPDPTKEGEKIATKKGICINAELLPRLIKALQKAEKALEKEQKQAEFEPERAQEGRSQEE